MELQKKIEQIIAEKIPLILDGREDLRVVLARTITDYVVSKVPKKIEIDGSGQENFRIGYNQCVADFHKEK